MSEQYQIDRAKAHLQIARYLMSKADERGTTHGEKHHVLFVALTEIGCALFLLGDDALATSARATHTDPQEITEIPF